MAVAVGVLSATRRRTLEAVCDTFAPSIELDDGGWVAIMLSNRPEFHVADLAAVMFGATPFSIYQTFAPSHIEFVICASWRSCVRLAGESPVTVMTKQLTTGSQEAMS